MAQLASIFSDLTFQTIDWTDEIVSDTPDAQRLTFQADESDDKRFRETIHTWASRIQVAHWSKIAVIAPQKIGGLDKVDFSCCLKLVEPVDEGAEMKHNLLLKQDGVLFVSKQAMHAKTHTWSSHNLKGLKASDFERLGPTTPAKPHRIPDFSSHGTEVTFGYMTSNEARIPSNYQTIAGLTQWSLMVVHHGAPSAQSHPPVPKDAIVKLEGQLALEKEAKLKLEDKLRASQVAHEKELHEKSASFERIMRDQKIRSEKDLLDIKSKHEDQLLELKGIIRNLEGRPASNQQIEALSQQHKEEMKAIEDRLAKLQSEHQALREELAKSNTENQQLQANLAELQTSSKQHLSALKQECKFAEDRVKQAEKERDAVVQQLQQAEREREVSKAKLKELDHKIAVVFNASQQADAKAQVAEKKAAHIIEAEQKKRQECERALQDARAKLQVLDKDITTNAIKLTTAKEENNKLKEQILDLELDLGKLKLLRDQEARDYKTSCLKTEQEYNQTKQKLVAEHNTALQKITYELNAVSQELKLEQAERTKVDAKLRDATAKLEQIAVQGTKTTDTIRAQLKSEAEARAKLQEDLAKIKAAFEHELAKEKHARTQVERELLREQEARRKVERELFIERDAIDHEFKEVTKKSEEAISCEWEVVNGSAMR